MSWHGQREKFDKFDIDLSNAHHNALKMRSKADDEPTQENVAAATTARETEAARCREFRNWCSRKRDDIPRILADPAQKFEDTERAGWQELHDDIVKRLPALEADCPMGDDPQPPRPLGTARRTRG